MFFGWWTVIAETFLNFFGSGYSDYGFSALFKPLSDELGFARETTAIVSSVSRLVSGIESMIVGYIVDRFGPKRIIMLGLGIFSLSLMLMWFVHPFWSFLVVWGLMGGSGSVLCWSTPVEKAITNWFVKKRGLAMGIRWLLSGMLLLPFITFIINNAGWRWACVIGGATMLCVGMPLAYFCIRDKRPEYYGLLPDGAKPKENVSETGQMVQTGVNYASEVDEVEFTARQAFATPTYWVMVVAQAIYGASYNAISVHMIPFLTDTGISTTVAAGMITVTGIFTLGLRFAGGVVIDRVPVKSIRFIFGAAYFTQAGVDSHTAGDEHGMAVYILASYYMGFGMSLTLQSFIWGRYFGRKAFGSIRGFSSIVMIPLAFISPIYTGWVFDRTGSYADAWKLLAGTCILAGVLMFSARPPKAPAKLTDVTKII